MKDLLAMRIKNGDEQAFELLFRKYYIHLCRFANKYLNNPDESKETVQEVFAKIWEGRDSIDPEESLNAYVFRITHNISINKLRRRQVESRYCEIYRFVYIDHHEETPYEALIGNELNEKITSAVSKMPPKCRKIFDLNRTDGLKYSEIANQLSISVKTVEAHMSKALNIVRLELKDYLKIMLLLL
jgi:RNA polymerase sigma-70 factor (ECF subfamily)